jgi:hypothetical protein
MKDFEYKFLNGLKLELQSGDYTVFTINECWSEIGYPSRRSCMKALHLFLIDNENAVIEPIYRNNFSEKVVDFAIDKHLLMRLAKESESVRGALALSSMVRILRENFLVRSAINAKHKAVIALGKVALAEFKKQMDLFE